ncbi:hypothetical protein M422DRAFT_268246 [Sphaerobolus stellatus SS14]|uniref:Uncharacterized protein n=1 Tax=Sphaerobolus stellatus (strain SS14) TaxID=990650 RepID=A0A0C9UY15_SPHS4|nr:hypothetical protein M422DRAFT_268246 [Sphaerobolus stellatus SS14]
MSVLVCTCRSPYVMVHHTSTIIQSIFSSIDTRVSSTTTANTPPSSPFPHHQRHAYTIKTFPDTRTTTASPSHSPFPGPSWSFVPPPMRATHEYAGVKRASAPTLNGAAKKKKTEDIDVVVPTKAKADATTAVSSSRNGRDTNDAYAILPPIPNTSPPTPTNINTSISTPSTSASAKHTSLSSSRPPPASPSAPPSRRQSLSKCHAQLSQSYQSPANSRRTSILSTASNSSASNTAKTSGDLSPSSTRRSSKRSSRPSTSASTSVKKLGVNPTTPTTPTPVPHTSPRGTIHIRDFAYPTPDPASHNVRARHPQTHPQNPQEVRAPLPSVLAPEIASHVNFVR